MGSMITRILFRAAPLLIGLFLLSTLASRLVGAAQAPSPMLTGFTTDCDGQAEACWYGIIPGVTAIQDARKTLEALGYQRELAGTELSDRLMPYRSLDNIPRCADVYFGYQVIGVKTVILWCMDITIGELMRVLGAPDGRVSYGPLGEDWVYSHLTIRLKPGWWRVPDAAVDHLRLVLDDEGYTRRAKPWHGFLPRWRYCQLEPDYEGCAA